jgi:hypothetical protein
VLLASHLHSAPTLSTSTSGTSDPPALSASLIVWRGYHPRVLYLPLLQLELHPLVLRLDERILVLVLRVFLPDEDDQHLTSHAALGQQPHPQSQQQRRGLPVPPPAPNSSASAATRQSGDGSTSAAPSVALTSKYVGPSPADFADDDVLIYAELLHFNTIALQLTFDPMPGCDESRDYRNPIRALGGLSSVAVSVEDAPVALGALQMLHPFGSSAELVRRVGLHYRAEALDELLKVLGSFSFLGNPTQLVHNVMLGLQDFVYEPATALQTAPTAGGVTAAVRKGTSSLVKRSVYGVFNSASKLASSIGSGAAWLAFDEDFLRERNLQQLHTRPRDVTEGLVQGVSELGQGLLGGLGGLISQPVRGAKVRFLFLLLLTSFC